MTEMIEKDERPDHAALNAGQHAADGETRSKSWARPWISNSIGSAMVRNLSYGPSHRSERDTLACFFSTMTNKNRSINYLITMS